MISVAVVIISVALADITTPLTANAQSWQKITVPSGFTTSGNYWLDVFFLPSNPQYGWVCGYRGAILRSTDGGSTWTGVTVPNQKNGHLESIYFLDTQVGYCSGPAGMWKSTDGGATWVEVTPNGGIGDNLWGCYFLNQDVGLVIGGGCAGGRQNFYRTTDGGTTWTRTQDSLANSGVTDLLLYPDGSGYAVGSGQLWVTADSGVSWSRYVSTGFTAWHEEIARVGNSFLLPVSGNSCSGGGVTGGGRFTTDNGASWNSFTADATMYGSFLLNSTTGWVCGMNRSMYYTSDGGVSWQLRNCGITDDLDDTWFINDTTGFVVGTNIWRYSPPSQSVRPSSLNFGVFCPPVNKVDTVWIRNRSWNPSQASISLGGADVSQFQIIQPTTSTFALPPCDSVMVLIRFASNSPGLKNATLNVTVPSSSTPLQVFLAGMQTSSSAVPVDTLVVGTQAQSGLPYSLNVRWSNISSMSESITAIERVEGSTDISTPQLPPFSLTPGSSAMRFEAIVRDTGWITSRYKFTIAPCNRDTFITFRIYGVSPIIDGPRRRTMEASCQQDAFDTIPITNTGNADLIISSASFFGGNDYTVVGWDTNEQFPITIKTGEKKGVIIRFRPTAGGNRSVSLRLINNDLTTARGQKNPFEILLQGVSSAPKYSIERDSVDFGKVCVGSNQERFITIENKGVAPITIGTPRFQQTAFTVRLNNGGFPAVIQPGGRTQVIIRFQPTTVGEFTDRILFGVQPCDEEFYIAVRGVGITSTVSLTPESITETLKAGEKKRITFIITSTGSDTAQVSSILERISGRNYTVIYKPTLPLLLAPGKIDSVVIELNPESASTVFNGTLCVDVSAPCPQSVCSSINAITTTSVVTILKNSMRFTAIDCKPQEQLDSIVVRNDGAEPDSLDLAELIAPSGGFSIVQPTQLPVFIPVGGVYSIIVKSNQTQEGIDTSTLRIRFAKGLGRTILNFGVKSVFRTAITGRDTTLNHSIFEPCDAPVIHNIVFRNTGTKDDRLTLVRANPISGINILSGNTVDVPALTTLGVAEQPVIQISPSDLPLGISTEELQWVSSVCSSVVRLRVNTEVVSPRLTVTPTTINFDTVWRDTPTQQRYITVKNNSTRPRSMTGYRLLSTSDNVFTFNNTNRTLLQPGDSVMIEIGFTATQSNTFNAQIFIDEESSCKDSTLVAIRAIVPSEFYKANVTTGFYSVYVGDTAQVKIRLTTADTLPEALWKAKPRSITLGMKYDENLTRVLRAYRVFNGKEVELAYTQENGIVRVTVPESVHPLLGSTDSSFVILSMLGMQSIPNVTPLDFVERKAETIKDYDITESDGYLSVRACMNWVELNFLPLYTVQLLRQPANNDVNLRIDSDGEQSLTFTLTDVLGNKGEVHNIQVNKGLQEVTIPTNGLSSGTYILECKSIYNTHVHIPVVITK
jgi:photosystem II stability/assembly factor-like uncharacterized protein